MYHALMVASSSLAGSAGAFAANFLLLLALETAGPLGDFPVSAQPEGRVAALVTLNTLWRPFIENPGDDPSRRDRQPRCPSPAGVAGGVRLEEAPLPSGYDGHAFPEQVVVACVKLDSGGRVTGVRLIHAPAAWRSELAAIIRSEWTFALEPYAPAEPGWQRVRLNSGAVDEPVYELPLLM